MTMAFERLHEEHITTATKTDTPQTKFGIYPSYLFVDHDPILDQVDTLIADSGMKLSAVAGRSHVSDGTLINWRLRKTKRPQFATVKAVVTALGAELNIVYRGRIIK